MPSAHTRATRHRLLRGRIGGLAIAGAVFSALLGLVGPVSAAERWTVAPFGAIAYAPPPVAARSVEAVQLDCRQQRWTLLLRVAADTNTPALPDTARLRIDRSDFELARLSSGRGVALKVPRELLDPLKSGGEMSIEVGEGPAVVQARLSLRGSRKAATRARSVSGSRAEVGSSRIRIGASRSRARAMAMRCFWPTESFPPPRPRGVA